MFSGFTKEAVQFLKDLEANNERDWFKERKSHYEEVLLNPGLALVTAMQEPLKKISPHFCAIPKRSGGSLMRIYRDVRFSKNKAPYKTNLGINFRHELGKDVHAPGFYVHIDTESVFVGAGIWQPDNPTLTQIRELIDDHQARWKRAKNSKSFKSTFELAGTSLKRPPRGFDETHPLIEDLKRKDFIGVTHLKFSELYTPKLVDNLAAKFKAAMPLMRFLCDALRVPC